MHHYFTHIAAAACRMELQYYYQGSGRIVNIRRVSTYRYQILQIPTPGRGHRVKQQIQLGHRRFSRLAYFLQQQVIIYLTQVIIYQNCTSKKQPLYFNRQIQCMNVGSSEKHTQVLLYVCIIGIAGKLGKIHSFQIQVQTRLKNTRCIHTKYLRYNILPLSIDVLLRQTSFLVLGVRLFTPNRVVH